MTTFKPLRTVNILVNRIVVMAKSNRNLLFVLKAYVLIPRQKLRVVLIPDALLRILRALFKVQNPLQILMVASLFVIRRTGKLTTLKTYMTLTRIRSLSLLVYRKTSQDNVPWAVIALFPRRISLVIYLQILRSGVRDPLMLMGMLRDVPGKLVCNRFLILWDVGRRKARTKRPLLILLALKKPSLKDRVSYHRISRLLLNCRCIVTRAKTLIRLASSLLLLVVLTLVMAGRNVNLINLLLDATLVRKFRAYKTEKIRSVPLKRTRRTRTGNARYVNFGPLTTLIVKMHFMLIASWIKLLILRN